MATQTRPAAAVPVPLPDDATIAREHQYSVTEATALRDTAAALGLSISAAFVPWSQSRGYKGWLAGETRRHHGTDDGNARKLTTAEIAKGPRTDDRSLNWIVTLAKDGREILTSEYGAGIGHCPSYKLGDRSQDHADAIVYETEQGKTAAKIGATPHVRAYHKGAPILPDPLSVIAAFANDASAIDSPTYEDWADDYGYDHDSRHGEAMYRACVEIGLKLRAALGDDGLAKLRDAASQY